MVGASRYARSRALIVRAEPGPDPSRFRAHGVHRCPAALSPRQRAVLIMCDVLRWRTEEAAALHGITVAANGPLWPSWPPTWSFHSSTEIDAPSVWNPAHDPRWAPADSRGVMQVGPTDPPYTCSMAISR
ncbi:sigma factor-like helix-turn-helix DNA-binding protein [Nocardia sp. NPDC005998]|uniref:sigma factor-like helix-turn-helix DNA-binding protein n=1 Tax=Nocardia sp. NPDC005998 TaxID=3156894 RepID=UPI0033B275D9